MSIQSVSYPTNTRNYCLFDEQKINSVRQLQTEALPFIEISLNKPKSEDDIIENLYVLNLLLDDGINKKSVSELYPILSKYNNAQSPNIQTFLAGIYRKTKIPDAFGPLVRMLIQNSINPHKEANFDTAEEIGGAILEYLA